MVDISTLIFSKDRGAQLELLLRTMRKFLIVPTPTTILYTSTWPKSEECYRILEEEYPEHIFIYETQPVQCHIKELINNCEASYTLLMCDDEVMYREFDLTTVEPLISQTLSCSLRLGSNINFNFPGNQSEALPSNIEINPGFIKWRWDDPQARLDFVYPMSVTDNIFHTKFLQEALSKISFHSVNSLEASLDAYKRVLTKPGSQSYMMCPTNSVFYSLPYNLVQQEYTWNRTTEVKLDLQEAITHFLYGERLQVTQGNVNACHCDFPYVWLHV